MLKRFAKLLADFFSSGEMDLETKDIIGLTRQKEWATKEISFTKIKEGSFIRSKFDKYQICGRPIKEIENGIVVSAPYVHREKETAWAAVDILANDGRLYRAIPINEITINDTE